MNPRFPGKQFFGAMLVSLCAASGVSAAADSITSETALAAESQVTRAQCAAPGTHAYRKTVSFTSFPRAVASTSAAGNLHQVDQQLPRLIAQQLHARKTTAMPLHLPGALPLSSEASDQRIENQVQQLAQKHRTQFIVSGEVHDMSMMFPGSAYTPGLYTRFVNGVHNTLHINTPLDKRYRSFRFQLELRDGLTGAVLFANHYQTFGKWKATRPQDVGFASPRFWKSDYGQQVQQLIAKASDELAAAIDCQPHIARIDARPGQQQVVIQSGANNGLRAGDTLELYQLVTQQAHGKYDVFNKRLVNRQIDIVLTEVYPSHSVAHVSDEVLLSGQYLALAP